MATIFYDDLDSSHMFFDDRIFMKSMEFVGGSMSGGPRLTVLFQGTSITLVGILDNSVTVMIDGESQPEVNAGGVILGFYKSPNLPDAMHNLTMASLPLPGLLPIGNYINVDYATVTAGKNTPIQGELIVDESEPSVVFEGNWTQNTNAILGGNRLAYANTTHQTSSMNASATFHFTGTTVSVFGVCPDPKTISLEIELDGVLDLHPLSSQNSSNYQLYHKEGLSSANHTLKMTNLGGPNNPTFNLDYIIYTPSFTSLAERDSGSQPPATNRATLLGALIGPVLFVSIIILTLLVMRKKKLLFWSSRPRLNTVNPFPPPHPSPQDLSQLRVHHKSSLTNGQTVVESPIPDEDLPLFDPSTTRRRWWAWHWRRSGSGTVEAFPSNWDPSSSRQPIARHKPALPTWHVTQQRASRQSDAGSAHETIVEDPRVQELEDMVLALQQEIEETRGQDRSGAQNGALMRELVTNRSEPSNERGRREQGDGGSVAVSTTVV